MPERPAPLVLVTTPPHGQPFGSHAAIAADGQSLLAADLSRRLGRLGAAVAPLPHATSADDEPFHWGRWFTDAARGALGDGAGRVDAVGYAGGSALALLSDEALDEILAPVAGEVVANNRFSADAFVVAGDLDAALTALEGCATDNAAPRQLNEAGFAWRDLGATPWARFDVDTTMDLALLRLATRLPQTRTLDGSIRGFLEMARLPGTDVGLEVPHLARIGEVIRDRGAELVVAGRMPATTWQELETETACRIRCLVEERGMRSARGASQPPRSILAALMDAQLTVRARGRAGAARRCGDPRHAGADGVGGRLVGRIGLASGGGALRLGLRRPRTSRDALAARADRGSRERIRPVPVRWPRARERRAAPDRGGGLAGPLATSAAGHARECPC